MMTMSPGWWALLILFLFAVVAGLAVGGWAVLRSRHPSGAARILEERLGRGEISPEEYQARLGALGPRPKEAYGPLVISAVALIVIGVAGTVIVGAAGTGRSMMTGEMGSMMGGGEPGRSGPAASAGAPTIRVTAHDFSFDPRAIRLQATKTVNLVFDNEGHMFHTFTATELGFELRANPGQSISGALTPERPGRYEFVCSVPGHANLGMRGTITVLANG